MGRNRYWVEKVGYVLNSKELVLLLAVLSFSFAAQTASLEYNGPLYRIYTPGYLNYLHVIPHLEFTETLRVSTAGGQRVISGAASDLQDDDIVCEGQVDIRLDTRGKWASGDLEQNMNYYQCDPPVRSGGINENINVVWDSDLYDFFYTEETCTADESCWGRTPTLIPQPANFVRTGTWFYGRESTSNVICKGVANLNSGSTLLSSGVIDGSAVDYSSTLTRGSYAFNANMEIDGCAAIVRTPTCPTPDYVGREEIFSRTSASGGTSDPQYSGTVGPATMNIRVVRDADLSGTAEVVSVIPSPVDVLPSGTQRVDITVRNVCSAPDPRLCQPITVTGVTVSNGFRFRFDTGGSMVPLGYLTINPGQAKTFEGILTAPAYTDCPTQLTFTAAYTYTGCTGNIGGTPATLNVPFDCPPPPGLQENITDLVPNFMPDLPSRVDIETGTDFEFSVITHNTGENSSNPGETCVNIGNWLTGGGGIPPGPPVRIFDDLEGVSPIRYSYGVIPPGGSVVHDPITFSCTDGMEGDRYLLIAQVDCMPSEGGTTVEGPGGEENNIVTRILECVPPGEGNETDHEGEHTCDVSPSIQTGFPLDTYQFRVTCDEGNLDDLCSGSITWDSHSGNVTYTSSDDLDLYHITVDGGTLSGTVTIEANVRYDDGNATCRAELNVPAVPCEEFV